MSGINAVFKHLTIDPKAMEALESYKFDPSDLGFGKALSPIMIQSDYKNGEWSPVEVVPYAPLVLSPTCKVFHYAQEIFEGMKAYYVDQKGPLLFRPEENAKRFNVSAERMVMPTLPEEVFIESAKAIAHLSKKFIPTQSGQSLYIRPFMFATEEHLGIKPADEFKFMVLASPSGAYFASESIKIKIERHYVRACPGGTGYAKTGGNYAASLKAVKEARDQGYDQTLWLDAIEREYVEELSGMNFFCIIDDVLVTPRITESILEGITRKSLIELAQHMGIKTREDKISITELLSLMGKDRCSEAFACGTAAIITPIGALIDADGSEYAFKNQDGPIAQELRKRLLDIQEGRGDDPFGWSVPV